MGKRYAKRMQRGQAMVEFALTSLLFILVVVSIIELARITHAYITIQHAARVGARYAVTGQWMPEFAGPNGAAHYNPDSGEPYERIYPCWPRFHDDPLPKAQTPQGPDYYEPFRGPRTCSIEKQVLQQMRPLALVPDAGFNQPGHYQVVVSSPASDSTPTSGQFTRMKPDGTPDTREYAAYYDNELPTAELVRGYAGKPNGQVIVQIRYNIRLVTPLLSNIVGYIPLQARVVMTNEAFGSTSVLTEAAPAPNMGPVSPLHLPIPADLTFVAEKTKNKDVGNTNPGLDNPVTYEVTITNSGELNAITSFQLCLYASQEELTGDDLSDPNTLDSMPKQCNSIPELEAGMEHKAEITFSSWDDTGPLYIYAVVDPATQTDEDDAVAGSIDEKGTDPSFPEQEENNWLFIEEIEVGMGVDLELLVSVDGDSTSIRHYSVGQTLDIQITVSNIEGNHDVSALSVHFPLPSQLAPSEPIPSGGYNGTGWSNVSVPRGGSTILVVNVVVNESSGPPVILMAEIYDEYLAAEYYEEDGIWPIWDDHRVNLQN